MNTTTLRGSSTADLLAIPGIVFGFQPEESVVVLALRHNRVEFGARFDLSVGAGNLEVGLRQIRKALRQVGAKRIAVLGFGRDVVAAAGVTATVAIELGRLVTMVFVSDGVRYWELPDDELPGGGTPYDVRGCAISAQAVFEGLPLVASRSEAVAAVQPPPEHRHAALAELLDEAGSRIAGLQPDERRQELRNLLRRADALEPMEAALLAGLLQEMELVWEAFELLDSDTSKQIRSRLVEARSVVVGPESANVLGLLGIACWLAGYGVQQTDCMTQLTRIAPGNLLLSVLAALHDGGTPPSRWRRIKAGAQ